MLFVLKRVVSSVLSALILLNASIFGYSSDKLKSTNSIVKVEDGFYTMDYVYDYDIDEMLEHGISSHIQLVLKGVFDIVGNEQCALGCTTFNSISSDGEYLFSRNFDYMDADHMLVWTHPKDGYASVSSVSLAFLGYDSDFKPDDSSSRVFRCLLPMLPLTVLMKKGYPLQFSSLQKSRCFKQQKRPI